jgi:tRNA(fMet)-specific endonuclease VapC
MGGVVDTSVFAACERKGWNAKQTIAHVLQVVPQPVLLSSVIAAELIEGIYRARTPQESDLRRAFVSDIFQAWPPIPFTQETAWIAGRIRGEQSLLGNTLPAADSLIAATALEFNNAIVTLNIRDFERIPGLRVIAFKRP